MGIILVCKALFPAGIRCERGPFAYYRVSLCNTEGEGLKQIYLAFLTEGAHNYHVNLEKQSFV